jgi:hypothetical protein
VDVNDQKGFFVLEDAGERRFEECFGDVPECDRRLQTVGALERRREIGQDAWRIPRRQQTNVDDVVGRSDGATLTRRRPNSSSTRAVPSKA